MAGSCRRWCRGRQRGSTETVYRFRKHWLVYTGLEKHAALCHLTARSKGAQVRWPQCHTFDPSLLQSGPPGADTARLAGKFSDYHFSAFVEFHATFCGIARQYIFKQNSTILNSTNGFERRRSSLTIAMNRLGSNRGMWGGVGTLPGAPGWAGRRR